MRRIFVSSRARKMGVLYSSSQTLEQIGERYGLTKERVRQILKKELGLSGKDGSHSVQAEERRREKKREKDARREALSFKRYGCSYNQLQGIRKIGKKMMGEGSGFCQTPIGAFRTQKSNARRRGIEWNLSFCEWWKIWQESGKWPERGLSKGGYVMARFGDVGPYSVGNVEFILATDNMLQGQARKQPLTRGHLLHSDHSRSNFLG